MPKITEIFAFIAEEGPDDEGVMGFASNGIITPLIGSDLTRVKAYIPIADYISKKHNKPYKIKRFILCDEL